MSVFVTIVTLKRSEAGGQALRGVAGPVVS